MTSRCSRSNKSCEWHASHTSRRLRRRHSLQNASEWRRNRDHPDSLLHERHARNRMPLLEVRAVGPKIGGSGEGRIRNLREDFGPRCLIGKNRNQACTVTRLARNLNVPHQSQRVSWLAEYPGRAPAARQPCRRPSLERDGWSSLGRRVGRWRRILFSPLINYSLSC